MPFFKNELRRPSSHYVGRQTYFITIVTENRTNFFTDFATGHWLLDELIATAAKCSFQLHAYCVMPDHLHFLPEGTSDGSNLIAFVDGFKQRTAFEFARRCGKRLWQRRYYDHILRSNDPIEDVACYILWNPVRKNLVTDPAVYPFTGSQTIEWMKRAQIPTAWKPTWK